MTSVQTIEFSPSESEGELHRGVLPGSQVGLPDTAAARLKSARLRRGYGTARAAAAALGMKVVTVYAHESGQRGIPRLAAASYARGYGVSVAWLLYGEAEAEAETRQLLSLTLRAARAEGRVRMVRETLRRLLTELDAADQMDG